MKKIFGVACALSVLFVTGAYAEGNGSGNPKNDPLYHIKVDTTPRLIWKDGKLVKNPEYSNKARSSKD